jgi:F0F1-type ATP synthase assembly protein I
MKNLIKFLGIILGLASFFHQTLKVLFKESAKRGLDSSEYFAQSCTILVCAWFLILLFFPNSNKGLIALIGLLLSFLSFCYQILILIFVHGNRSAGGRDYTFDDIGQVSTIAVCIWLFILHMNYLMFPAGTTIDNQ